ncbi:MAG TPA: tetratricopeptide repeat protein [Chitinophagales bacterium]|nr:tetratricopeptide repeat protein [Chitinophagales bacterium]
MKQFVNLLVCFLIFPMIALAQSPATSIENGNKAYALKNFTEAKQYYETALKQDVNKQFPQAHFNLGNVYFHLGNFKSAIDEYQKFIAATSENDLQSQAYYNTGTCCLAQKSYGEAIDAFKKALQLNPKNEDARYNLSYALAIISNQRGGTSSAPDQSTSPQKKNKPKELPPLSPEEQQKLLNALSQSEAKAMKNNLARSNQSSLKKDW